MKLLICLKCSSVIQLKSEWRRCTCGLSGGHYLEDNWNAEISGPAVILLIGNGSLINAVYAAAKDPPMDPKTSCGVGCKVWAAVATPSHPRIHVAEK